VRWIVLLPILCAPAWAAKKPHVPQPTDLDRYVADAKARSSEAASASPGSIWLPGSRLADAARDVRASQVDDLVTIVVAEQASAVTSGTTKTQRTSSTKNSITALAGVTKSTGPWANLANVSGNTQLDGQGTTSRTTTLSTTLTARVIYVLPKPRPPMARRLRWLRRGRLRRGSRISSPSKGSGRTS
jgi:flagellar L-ring protein precursor FlgH